MPERTDRESPESKSAAQAPRGDGKALPPFTIVLLGGVACGKSTIASLLGKQGAIVLDADRIAHEELERPEVVAAVRETWGERVLAGGRVDRRRLGEVVFDDAQALAKLEALVHPRVLARIADRLRELSVPEDEASGRPVRRRVVVLDVPLAGETALAPLADVRLFVEASVETRRRRAREQRGWSEGELERREARQLSLAKKQSMADAVVRNDAGVLEAERDVERFWSSVVEPRIQERR
jgi:dephospho-CoA kinase